MYVIASVKHTNKHHEHITFWGKNECGYALAWGDHLGQYTQEQAEKLNDGLDCIAVPVEAAKALLSPEPYYQPGKRFYDTRGSVIDNTRANWNALIKARLPTSKPRFPVDPNLKVKPEVFRGTRRCNPAFGELIAA